MWQGQLVMVAFAVVRDVTVSGKAAIVKVPAWAALLILHHALFFCTQNKTSGLSSLASMFRSQLYLDSHLHLNQQIFSVTFILFKSMFNVSGDELACGLQTEFLLWGIMFGNFLGGMVAVLYTSNETQPFRSNWHYNKYHWLKYGHLCFTSKQNNLLHRP